MSYSFNKGDYVCRISHNKDILFKVVDLVSTANGKQVLLKGADLRLCADAPLQDLIALTPSEVNHYRQGYLRRSTDLFSNIQKRRRRTIDAFLNRAKINYKKPEATENDLFELPGSVLHLDGDKDYLDLCMSTYKQLNIRAVGAHVPENEQAGIVKDYLLEHTPDILICTGHDGILKGRKNFSNPENYRNSAHFCRTVRRARELVPGRDDLVIFAGACQSHYESLIRAGANFASSPRRVLIHAYDPVFIAEKLAYTPFYQMVPIKETLNDTITGPDGVGGIETHGRLRLGYPKSPY